MPRRISEALIIQTLFGPEVATKQCNCCGKIKYVHEFYCETPSKVNKQKRDGEQVRNQCIDCWAIHRGSVWRKKYMDEKSKVEILYTERYSSSKRFRKR